jgi:ribonuclease HIII
MNVANNNKPMNIMDMHVENYAPLSDGGPSNQEKQYYPYSHIGCDETGSGDFFGPLCVVACYIDERDYDWLASLNVRDPKLMTSQEVIEIAREIKDRLVYSLLILDNSHYNQMAAAGNNLANIKAKLYNQAMINVIQRIEHPISKVTIDAFLAPKKYYRYLKSKIVVVRHIEFKKEEMSLAMKCAHILSQYAYLQYYQNMCQSLNTTLPRGFNILANDAGTSLVQEHGKDILWKVSKTNFPNYKQILERVE